jgi:hypothetical protein
MSDIENIRVTDTRGMTASVAKDIAKDWAEAIHKSCMFKTGNVQQALLIAWDCLYRSMPPLQWRQRYQLIQGVITMKAESMLAIYFKSGGKVKWINQGDEGDVAEAEFELSGNTQTVKFSIEDAKKADLIKKDSAWLKNPGSMLRARMISKAMRMLAPHLIDGAYVPEEAMTFDHEPSVIGMPDTIDATTETTQKTIERLVAEPESEQVEESEASTDAFGDVVEKPAETITPQQVTLIKELISKAGTPKEKMRNWMEQRGFKKLAELTGVVALEMIATLEKKIAKLAAEQTATDQSATESVEQTPADKATQELNEWSGRVLGEQDETGQSA